MNITALPSKQDDISAWIQSIETLLPGLGLEIREAYSISEQEMIQIHTVASDHSCLETNDKKCYQKDAENGVLKLYQEGKLLGYIFAHRGEIDNVQFFERGSLWVSTSIGGNNLGKYLMMKMTERLSEKNILSVTSNRVVQSINELIMDYEVVDPKGRLKEMIETRGKMKNDYRYFVNESLMRIL